MYLSDVMAVLAALQEERVRFWVAGGWAVDALLGRQSREHRDLDLALDAAHEAVAMAALERLGYVVETDQRPARVEVAGPGECWVDLHPVVLGHDGSGRQADLSGGFFEYPPEAFTCGVLGGRPVDCLSAGQQLRFRSGYALRPQDHHDIAILSALQPPT